MSSSTPESPGRSRPVVSNQSGPHPGLAARIARCRAHVHRRPLPAHARAPLAILDAAIAAHAGPVVLDSGCGTGESSLALAAQHPAALVIGIDKSAARLARAARLPPHPRVRFVRTRLEDAWRHARAEAWPVAAHYLLYPNPWPKQHQLARRWHAQAAFADLIALGGRLEMRTNWAVYAAEFALALGYWGGPEATVETLPPGAPLSAFERKYRASGHALYRVAAVIPRSFAEFG
ncbi:MAG: methyltransferase domain-containing protein [Gammaproteobacteria bacterium]|nr:methyltransferase domain-containing protein [Gammaproteobacteria bacterium]